MQGVNMAVIIGNLGKTPDLRQTASGQSVANFSVATNERWKDKAGQKQERTEWHRIVVWGPQADACAKYLERGSGVYVQGRLQTREWTNKEGAKQYTTEIVAVSVVFLDRKQNGEREDSPPSDEDEGFGPPPE